MIFDELCEKLGFEVNYAKSQHRRISEALHLEKLPPQLYQIKMKICYDQGCNYIGTVFLGFRDCPKSFKGAFSSSDRLDVREV